MPRLNILWVLSKTRFDGRDIVKVSEDGELLPRLPPLAWKVNKCKYYSQRPATSTSSKSVRDSESPELYRYQ